MRPTSTSDCEFEKIWIVAPGVGFSPLCLARRVLNQSKSLIILKKARFLPRGHSITKHTGVGGGLARRSESKPPKYLSKNSNIRKMLKSYPLNILKVQSESSKISNLEQIFIFTENCIPNYPYE